MLSFSIAQHYLNEKSPASPVTTLHPVPCATCGMAGMDAAVTPPSPVIGDFHPPIPPSPLPRSRHDSLPEPSVLLHCQFSVLAGFQQDSHRDR